MSLVMRRKSIHTVALGRVATPQLTTSNMPPDSNSMPSFIGVGSQRCGTTWLAACLAEHPEIFVPEKEIRFFDCHFDKGHEWYTQKFEHNGGGRITGEYTPDYLPHYTAMKRIASLHPTTKLIISVRDPIERALSALRLYRSRGIIATTDLEEAVADHPHLIQDGLYAKHINHALSSFDREQIFFVLMDDISNAPQSTLTKLYSWLGVSSDYKPPSLTRTTNISLHPRIQYALDKVPFLRKFASSRLAGPAREFFVQRRKKKSSAPNAHAIRDATMSQAISVLRPLFFEDTKELGEILKRDLSEWVTLKHTQ